MRKNEIEESYDRWSDRYDSQRNETRDLDELVLRRICPPLNGLIVVECGCGTGKNSSWISSRCSRLVGLDFSAGMLAVARSKVGSSNTLFVRSDLLEPWPIAPASSDVVLFNLVLEHISDLAPVFREAGAALRRGGVVLLSEYHPTRIAEGKGPVVAGAGAEAELRIPNYLHTLQDFAGAGVAGGLRLVSASEWGAGSLAPGSGGSEDNPGEVPQLLSILFRKE